MIDQPSILGAEVVHARPPNFEAIAKVFPDVMRRKGILYAYGDKIYNPDKVQISPAKLAHEKVHSIQQKHAGGPEAWWDRYLADKAFRLKEELKAHVVEYHAYCRGVPTPPRKQRAAYLDSIADRMSLPMYGAMTTRAAILPVLKKAVKNEPQEADRADISA